MIAELASPSPLTVFFFQFTLSHVALALLAVWYVLPALRKRPVHDALSLLVVPFLFRHVGATTLVVGVVTAEYSQRAAWIVTVGDSVSVVLAALTIALLRRRSRWAVPSLVLFSLENVGYSLGLVLAEGFDAVTHGIGAHWYIGTFYVPVMLVAQVAIIVLALERRRELRPARA